MKISRLLVIGDIHGEWDRFQDVFRQVEFNPDKDMLVFMGDYLDRGHNPVPVMDWVLAHQGKRNMIFLRGNHEQMFYEALRKDEQQDGLVDFRLESPRFLWLCNGGAETYEAIKKDDRRQELVHDWLELIEKLPLYAEVELEGQTYWFMHADCDPETPLKEQSSKKLLWGRTLAKYPGYHNGDQVIVLGHTPVQALFLGAKPSWQNNGKVVLMDTGSYMEKGHISCADLLTREVWQSE